MKLIELQYSGLNYNAQQVSKRAGFVCVTAALQLLEIATTVLDIMTGSLTPEDLTSAHTVPANTPSTDVPPLSKCQANSSDTSKATAAAAVRAQTDSTAGVTPSGMKKGGEEVVGLVADCTIPAASLTCKKEKWPVAAASQQRASSLYINKPGTPPPFVNSPSSASTDYSTVLRFFEESANSGSSARRCAQSIHCRLYPEIHLDCDAACASVKGTCTRLELKAVVGAHLLTSLTRPCHRSPNNRLNPVYCVIVLSARATGSFHRFLNSTKRYTAGRDEISSAHPFVPRRPTSAMHKSWFHPRFSLQATTSAYRQNKHRHSLVSAPNTLRVAMKLSCAEHLADEIQRALSRLRTPKRGNNRK